MDEVTVMSAAGELTGRVVGHGVRLARRAAVTTGRGVSTLGVAAVHASSRATADAVRARRRVAARAGALDLPRVELPRVTLPSTDGLRRDLAAAVAPRRRRRWPWVLGGLGVLAGGAAVLAARRPVAPPPAPAPPRVEDVRPAVSTETADPAVED